MIQIIIIVHSIFHVGKLSPVGGDDYRIHQNKGIIVFFFRLSYVILTCYCKIAIYVNVILNPNSSKIAVFVFFPHPNANFVDKKLGVLTAYSESEQH